LNANKLFRIQISNENQTFSMLNSGGLIMVKRRIHIGISLLLLVSLTFSACNKKQASKTSNETEGNTVAVSVAEASRRTVNSFTTLNGKVQPIREVNIVPRMAGKVASVNFEVGQYVREGDILFTLEDKDIRLQVNQAAATRDAEKVTLETAKGGTKEQQINQLKTAFVNAEINLNDAKLNYEKAKQLYEANTAVKTAELNYNNAKAEYERTKQLYEVGGVSQQAMEKAETNYRLMEEQYTSAKITERQPLEAAETRLKLAQEQYDAAKSALEIAVNKVIPESIKMTESRFQQAQAAYDSANAQLEKTIERAPISGVIATKNINVGEMVGVTASVMSIIDLSSVTVDINLPENIINKIQLNDKVKVNIQAAGIEGLEGQIISISPAVDQRTQGYAVKVSINNENGLLKSGMFAEIEITTDEVHDAIAVPIESVVEEDGKKYVFVVKGDQAVKTEIVTGLANDEYVEVVEGLQGNETVVVKGQNFIKDDSKITIVEQR